MTNPIPTRTTEQRREALEKAVIARKKRAEVRMKLEKGTLGLDDVLDSKDEAIRRMKIYDLLRAYRGIGDRKAYVILDRLGIAVSRRVAGLGAHQRKRLKDFIAQREN